jgi:hypothetical protein
MRDALNREESQMKLSPSGVNSSGMKFLSSA